MKKYLLSGLMVLTLLLLPVAVSAAEITPASSAYGYGSTSEFSNEVNASSSSSSLASTGDPANMVKIIAIVLIVVGAGVGIRALIRRKQKS